MLALLVALGVLAPASATPHPVRLDPFTSAIKYSPNRPGFAPNAWNATFMDSPWSGWVNGTDNVPWGTGYRTVCMEQLAPPVQPYVLLTIYPHGRASGPFPLVMEMPLFSARLWSTTYIENIWDAPQLATTTPGPYPTTLEPIIFRYTSLESHSSTTRERMDSYNSYYSSHAEATASAAAAAGPRFKCGGTDCPVRADINFYGTAVEFWGWWGTPGGQSPPGSPGEQYGAAAVMDAANNTVMQASGTLPNGGLGAPVKLGEAKFLLGNHTVGLVPMWGNVTFAHAVVYMEIPGSKQNIERSASARNIIPLALASNASDPFSNAMRNPAVALGLTGTWFPVHALASNSSGVNSTFPNRGYPRLQTYEANARLALTVPKGNRFLRINGTSAWNHGTFRLDITPAPPGRAALEYHNTSASWSTPNTTLYVAALDPAVEYDVALTNIGSQGGNSTFSRLDVHAVELWPVGADEKAVPPRVIAGAAVGGGLGLLILLGGAVAWFQHRRAKARAAAEAALHGRSTDAGPAGTAPLPPLYDERWDQAAPAREADAATEVPTPAATPAPATGEPAAAKSSSSSTSSAPATPVFNTQREIMKSAVYLHAVGSGAAQAGAGAADVANAAHAASTAIAGIAGGGIASASAGAASSSAAGAAGGSWAAADAYNAEREAMKSAVYRGAVTRVE